MLILISVFFLLTAIFISIYLNMQNVSKHNIIISIILVFASTLMMIISIAMKKSSKPDPGPPKPGPPKKNKYPIWYPEENIMKPDVNPKNVTEFLNNLGTIIPVHKRPSLFTGPIQKDPICQQDEDRLLLANYITRVYNGTSIDNILRLNRKQLSSFIENLDWVYITPNMPKQIEDFFNQKRRTYEKEQNKPAHSIPAKISSWGYGYSPINVNSSNWSGDHNQSYLFQTIMKKDRGDQKWWGNWLFTDPTRASLRRGMMNTPQNNTKLFDKRFGYGGVPSNVLFEGGILPVDSAFAPAGMIHGPLAVPNICNVENNKTCELKPIDKNTRSKAVYTYFTPGSGMFFESGECTYMYSFVDGFLNIPEECYNDTNYQPGDPATKHKDGTWPDKWSDVISKRLPNGLPDHVVGVSKLLIYLARKVVWGKRSIEKALIKEEKTKKGEDKGGFAKGEASKWKEAIKWPLTDELDVRLPLDADIHLQRGEERFKNGGLGLEGNVNPLDMRAPPRAYEGPRALQAQVAALMGVYESTSGTFHEVSRAQYYGHGLFTKDGKPTLSKCPFIDKRKYAIGWINGRWYGYPPESKWNTQTEATKIKGAIDGYKSLHYDLKNCQTKIGGKYAPNSKATYAGGGVYTKGGKEGVPGIQEEMNEKWNNGYFMPTKSNPLIYYGFIDPKTGKKEELYRTWYGKPIQMDYVTACKMLGMFYSMGCTGWEEAMVCWPFGSYFSYAEDLGLGKYVIGENMQTIFGSQSLHYTMTSTSLSKSQLVSPAYDYEIVLTIPDKSVQSLACFCKHYMKSVDLLYNDGKHLAEYCNPAKGALGGWYPIEAGRPYDGTKGISNFTYVMSKKKYDENADAYKKDGVEALGGGLYGSFNPNNPNMITGLNNVLLPQQITKCK